MIIFDMAKLVPKFLLADRDGAALAAAIGAGLKAMDSAVENGLKTLQSVVDMPEWRLDEYAEELGCLYDKQASADEKRAWIQEAYTIAARHGTQEAIVHYLSSMYDSIEVEEAPKYNGQPYHFRLTAYGGTNEVKTARTFAAIGKAKNTRSVLDGFAIGKQENVIVTVNTDHYMLRSMLAGQSNCGAWNGFPLPQK